MPYLTINEITLYYEKEGAGPKNIIFIHGNFSSSRWWSQQLSNLPDDYTAYALDLRGCGNSDHPSKGYDIKTLTRDLLNFTKKLGLSRFHLVGHSLGGALAQEFQARYPACVTSLILVAPVPAAGLSSLHGKQPGGLLGNFLSPEQLFRSLSSLKLHKPLIQLAMRRSMPGCEHWKEFKSLVEIAVKMSPQAFHGFLRLIQTWHHPAPEKTICPVLLIHGTEDPVVPANELIAMAKQLPDCYLVTLKSVGHAPQMEQPETFRSLLFSFVNAVEEPTEKEQFNDILRRTGQTIPHQASSIRSRILQWIKQRIATDT